jgi:aryl-alcohol dehydrogenase-like predicted oxidoreductase
MHASAPARPQVVLGTMTFADTVDESAAAEIVDAAAAAGVTHLDTANVYAGGRTEEMLGRLLAARGDGFTLATKAGIPHPDADGVAPLSAEGLRRSIRGSLHRLGRDSVDLFYLHQPDRSTDPAETAETLAALHAEGLFSSWGVSNFSAWRTAQMTDAAARAGLGAPDVQQQLYSLVARRFEPELQDFSVHTGIRTLVYNPLGGGLLSGRIRRGETPADGRFADSALAGTYRGRYLNDQTLSAVEQLAAIAEAAGLTLPEFALRWLLARDGVDGVLIGGSRLAHITANVAALGRGPLPDDLVATADDITAPLFGPLPAPTR